MKQTNVVVERSGIGTLAGRIWSTQVPLLGSVTDLVKLLAVTAQLGLVLLAIHLFRIEETSGFHQLLTLILGGFLIHACLPLRLRMPFFLVLTLAAAQAVFGTANALWLISIGLGLIALCHVPVPFAARVGLVLAAGGALAALRAQWLDPSTVSVPMLVLPILGSMFMFRMIIYLYDLRHEKTPATLWQRLCYFFLLPNVCFPLFPVVDYQVFRRSYYSEDAFAIYQKGVLWIFRGVTHLLLYRLVYYYFTPSAAEVQGLGGVVVFIVSSYLLYLRISGQFHLIIGVLCLFGFNLPETHHLYFLASGFNDVWRRLNIYWKDFMVKIFYYPVLMRLRGFGMTQARVVATLCVFVVTWLLHSYQWFWLRGTFPLTVIDGMYWGILGVLVVFNTLAVTRQLRRRKEAAEAGWSLGGALVQALKVVGMFVFMSVLWSFWSSTSIGEWVSVVSMATQSGAGAYGLLLLGVAVLVGVGVLAQYVSQRGWRWFWDEQQMPFARTALVTGLGIVLLVGVGLPEVQGRLGSRAAGLVASLQEGRLNQRDEEMMVRGYYEGLLEATNAYTSELWWSSKARSPRDWEALMASDAVRPGEGVFDYELIPSYTGTLKQAPFVTNQWGMRDSGYAQTKPPQTYRIAFLGASIEMGAGVDQDQIYEALLEDRLNTEQRSTSPDRYEILNFSVGGYSVIQNVAIAEEKVFAFDPDIVLYAVHATEDNRLLMQLTNLVRKGRDLPYPYLQDVVRQAGAEPGMTKTEIRRRLEPFANDIIRWSFAQIAAACSEQGVRLVGLLVPHAEESVQHREDEAYRHRMDQMAAFAEEAGLETLDLKGAFDGHEAATVQLAPWDQHLGVVGHQLLAERLYQVLQENDPVLGLGLSGAPVAERPYEP